MSVAVQEQKPLIQSFQNDQEEYFKKFRVPWKEVQRAIDQGYIIPEWNLADYIRAAVKGNPNDIFAKRGVKKLGYVNVNIWGEQGATKSNIAWQLLDLLYQDWRTSFERMVVTMEDLLANYGLVRGVNRRLPGLVIDDLTSLVPKQLWFVDKDLHILLQQFLAVLRTKIGFIGTTTPNIEFTWESLGEVVSIEVIVYPNQSYKAERYCWDIDPQHPLKARFSKVVIEFADYDPLMIPKDIWMEYQAKREKMADTVFGNLVDHWAGMGQQNAAKELHRRREIFKDLLGPNKERTLDEFRNAGLRVKTETAYQMFRIMDELVKQKEEQEGKKTPLHQ